MAQREIVIIGGGIAGLSAALIARQIGHDTLVLQPPCIPGRNALFSEDLELQSVGHVR